MTLQEALSFPQFSNRRNKRLLLAATVPQLDRGVREIQETGEYTLELTSSDTANVMRDVVGSLAGEGKAVSAIRFDRLFVSINGGRAEIQSAFTASTSIGEIAVTARITLENVLEDGVPSGRIRTVSHEVHANSMFQGTIRREVEKKIGGENINATFFDAIKKSVADKILLSNLHLSFTPENTLKLTVTGEKILKDA